MTLAAGTPPHTRRSSDLSKRSAEVFAEAEKHPVTVTRRDGESLVLMSAREAQGRRTDELGPEWFRSLARQGHVGVIGVTTALLLVALSTRWLRV